MNRSLLRPAVMITLVTAASCASAGTAGGGRNPGIASSASDVLTGAEVLERAPGTPSVLQAVRRFKGTWLRRTAGTTSFQNVTSPIRVYLDGISVGTSSAVPVEFVDDSPNLQYLDSYSIERTYEIRYYNARDATQRWGTGHSGGVIEIISGTPGVAPDRAPEPVPDPTTTFGPFEPFESGLTWFVHSGTANITAPVEVSEVWSPDVNVGGGFGIHAARTITLFASVEVNRFQFSPAGTINYFMNRPQGKLQSSDGVEVIGDPSTIFNASANVKVHPERGVVRPYLFGGIGYARFNAGAFSVGGAGGTPLPRSQFSPGTANGGDQTENSFSVGGGFGLDIGDVAGWRLFGDARYITGIRGPRYKDAYQRFQLFNTRYYPLRFGLSYR